MNLLQLHGGYKQFGARIIFENAGFAINENEHVGVIGPNGAGKTTLFKVLMGLEKLDSGEIVKSQKLRVGYLEQESDWSLDESSESYLAQNCIKPIWELKQLGLDLGLTEEHFQMPIRSLSGGYRMRMKLLYLIGQEPNLMLLDEPTNFLDLESILALEKFLVDFKGAFLLISHDREFLRRVTESTLEVEAGDITKFPGNIDDYFEQKAQLRTILEAQIANQDTKKKQILDFVERFGAKATKAKQAQSRLKQLDKFEKIEIKDLPVKAKIKIPSPTHTGKEVFHLQNCDLGYAQADGKYKIVLTKVDLRVERGDHIGIVGFNGAGKSTLLKSIGERIPLLSGQIKWGYQVTSSYFAQHVTEDLCERDNVIESLQAAAHPDVKAQEILNMAGSLLFSGDDIKKKIAVLSGGEKSRVALGQLLLKKSPVLFLDEPTNHLDFDTVEAMTEALRAYEGTVLVVSHDRSFIGRIATKILEIRDGSVETYPGSYEEYVWSLEKGALSERGSRLNIQSLSKEKAVASTTNEKFNFKEESKKIQSQIKEIQRKISKCEELIFSQSQKREEFNALLITAKGVEAQSLSKELSYSSREIEKLEEQLLEYLQQVEDLEKRWSQFRD
jgi:ATP-binding cassette, subfamily F, member 3